MGRKKEIEQYDKLLQKHIDKRHIVKLCREFKMGERSVYGYILSMSQHFLLIQELYDFNIHGYVVVPKDGFDSLRYNKYDKRYTKIAKLEGIDKHYGIGYDIDLSGWQQLFASIKAQDLHVIIECENLKEPSFSIGPIIKAGKRNVRIRYYDATGKLDSEPTKIPYEDITWIQFDDMYSKVFRKYLIEPKSKAQK